MSQLEELEAIKRLKYKYIRCIDSKLWKELREVFSEDADAAYNKGQYTANGIDEVMEFLVGALTRTDVASMHNVHCPEIDLTSETTAKGTWYSARLRGQPGRGQRRHAGSLDPAGGGVLLGRVRQGRRPSGRSSTPATSAPSSSIDPTKRAPVWSCAPAWDKNQGGSSS